MTVSNQQPIEIIHLGKLGELDAYHLEFWDTTVENQFTILVLTTPACEYHHIQQMGQNYIDCNGDITEVKAMNTDTTYIAKIVELDPIIDYSDVAPGAPLNHPLPELFHCAQDGADMYAITHDPPSIREFNLDAIGNPNIFYTACYVVHDGYEFKHQFYLFDVDDDFNYTLIGEPIVV